NDDKLIADVNRLMAVAEVMRQAKEHGDDETYQACLANKYDGVLPVQKADGTWTDLYKQSLSFSIAGINFLEGIREKLGDIDILFVPEPNNEHDPNAIKVMSSDGIHLGYVPASMTDEVRTFTTSAFLYLGTATITEETDERGICTTTITTISPPGAFTEYSM
ncbi:MAG: HIRAN domain-containing protein, partial [Clostridia bacterium]|nr:HIRAN domain-containing protein [Clostridia bacterium]